MAEEAGKTIYEKLAEVQSELKSPKARNNDFAGFVYRKAEDILQAAKPLCLARGMTILLNDTVKHIEGRWYVEAQALVADTEGNLIAVTAQAREPAEKKGMDAAQITGAASSYARKYALSGLFAVDNTDTTDPDSQAPAQPAKKTTKTTPAAKPAPPAKKAEPKDSDPVTDLEKRQLGNMMNALGMDADAKSLMVESVLEKPTVDTHGDFQKVVDAMNESPADETEPKT